MQNDIVGARCLDLFAGSGALGLEALSRGADYALLVDNDPKVVTQIKNYMTTLQASGGEVHQADVLQILASGPENGRFDLTFLDPPFGRGLIAPCLETLESQGWLAENAKIYIEVETDLPDLSLPSHWEILRQQKAGQVTCYLVARRPSRAES